MTPIVGPIMHTVIEFMNSFEYASYSSGDVLHTAVRPLHPIPTGEKP